MPSINQCCQGFPAVITFKINKFSSRTQITHVTIESPKPFLNQYALDINGVQNKISLNIWALKLTRYFQRKEFLMATKKKAPKRKAAKKKAVKKKAPKRKAAKKKAPKRKAAKKKAPKRKAKRKAKKK